MTVKKQVNVSLTYEFIFYPEDLSLDKTAHRTALMDYADMEVDKIIQKISNATGLMPDEINIEVCEEEGEE